MKSYVRNERLLFTDKLRVLLLIWTLTGGSNKNHRAVQIFKSWKIAARNGSVGSGTLDWTPDSALQLKNSNYLLRNREDSS